MQTFLPWASRNLGRFVVVWGAIATVVFAVVDFNIHDVVPHSPIKVLFLPGALALIFFVAAFTAFVALVFGLPVFGVWLLVYLPVLWWSVRFVQGNAQRALAVVLAPLPFALLRTGDWAVSGAAVAVALAYGFVVHLPPTPSRSDASVSNRPHGA